MQNSSQSSPKRRRYQKDLAPTDDIVTLIMLVRQNPALYNYKLQPNQRRRSDILNGWAQIAAAIGNKYTVEECRRKWKNLRDTYHQYRLRRPKMGDGLAKWRYAKDMDFLSNVYQPKLKSNRTQNFNATAQETHLLHNVNDNEHDHHHDQVVAQEMVHSSIITVGDTDTFILTSYEDVTHDTHEDPNMVGHDELHDHSSIEGCVEIVKQEHNNSLDDDDDDGNAGTEVDYEEVCLYEDTGNSQVDCETIIGGAHGGNSENSDDTNLKYIDENDLIRMINPTRSQYSSSSSSVMGSAGSTIKLKTLPIVSSSTSSLPSTSSQTNLDATSSCVTLAATSSTVHLQTLPELTPSPILPSPTAQTTNGMHNSNNNNNSNNITKHDQSTCLIISPNHTTSTTQQQTTHISQQHHSSQLDHQQHEQVPPPPTYTSTSTATSTNISHTNMSPITNTTAIATPITMQCCNHPREECDLFFDFLKKKLQRFPREEITSIQVEFLNCVLRRESELILKSQHQQQQQQHHQNSLN